jgi:hypothetical protein
MAPGLRHCLIQSNNAWLSPIAFIKHFEICKPHKISYGSEHNEWSKTTVTRQLKNGVATTTLWAADFETPAGSSTFLSFFLGIHRQK